jgi:4-hydroxy-3-polyprenylbenzoate decarboxylase
LKRLVVAVTGASGAIYATRFLARAAEHFDEILITLSEQALQVLSTETDLKADRETFTRVLGIEGKARLLNERDYFTPPASGSYRHDGMVIVPCSMGTLGRVANGISNDLTTRAADVCLKEGRKLILVVREMPYNLVMMRNMVAVAEAGATVLPASPAWYNRPANLEELADTVVARILQNLGIDQKIVPEWASEQE